MKKKLSFSQLFVIEHLTKNNCAIKPNGVVIDERGYAIKLVYKNTVEALTKMGVLTDEGRISEKFKESAKDLFNQ